MKEMGNIYRLCTNFRFCLRLGVKYFFSWSFKVQGSKVPLFFNFRPFGWYIHIICLLLPTFKTRTGNYGGSKSLILTVFINRFFIHSPLLVNYTTLLQSLEGNFEKLSKTQKRPHLYQQVNNKKTTLFSMLLSFELQVPRSTRWLFCIAFLSYKFSKIPRTFSKTLILYQNLVFFKSENSLIFSPS